MNQNSLYKTLLLEGIHPLAKDSLLKAGLQVENLAQTPNTQDLIKKLDGVSILGSRSRTHITKDILDVNSLLCVGAFCIGTNQIDLEQACKKGVAIFNAPYSNTRSVAEMVIAFIISLSRNFFDASAKAHQGLWQKSAKNCFEVRGKTLGIIGYGNIGSQLSILAESLGMKVIYYDLITKLPIGNAKPTHDMSSLLAESDFVSLHIPETPENINLIDANQFNKMKKSSFFINTSRGTVVNILDLKKALDSGHLLGAALDVYPQEPANNKEPFKSELQKTERLILTPHIGGSTEEAQQSIGIEVSKNLKDFILLGSTENSVNFPQLHLPAIPPQAKRISNIHKNQPGVLSQINSIVSQSQGNIKNQYLSTNKEIGYLVMDIEKDNVQDLSKQMNALSTSIKTRIIF